MTFPKILGAADIVEACLQPFRAIALVAIHVDFQTSYSASLKLDIDPNHSAVIEIVKLPETSSDVAIPSTSFS